MLDPYDEARKQQRVGGWMSDNSSDAEYADGTEALFDKYVARRDAGEPLSIDDFCAEYPERAPQLRDLCAVWQHARDGLETAAVAARQAIRAVESDLLAQYRDRELLFARRYRPLAIIKSGGMGTILRARDLDVERDVAIKFIRDQWTVLAGNRAQRVPPYVIARFLNEAKVTGQLEHPAIVPVHEIGVDEHGRPFFVMKLVHGRELEEVFALARNPHSGWTQARAIDALFRVCEALAYAHDKGVVHRDLKPANVMVGDFGEVYVMDWGLAKQPTPHSDDSNSDEDKDHASDPTASITGRAMGTPSYMPPEQAAGDHQRIGPQSDVYAVGAMLYHLLAGGAPFQPRGELSTPSSIRARVLRGELEPLLETGHPAELQAICAKAMAREPSDRYSDMRELAADLRAYLEGRVVRAHDVSWWAELRKWMVRNKTVCALGATTVGSVLVGLGVVAWSQARARTRIELESDIYRVPYLLVEAQKKLWPSSMRIVPEMHRWIADADNVLSRSAAHRALAVGVGSEATLRTAAHDLSAGLAELADARRDMLARIAVATYVERRLISTDADAWSQAIADIADVSRSHCYGGLRIRSQEGLVPIGKDPCSGLWEFADLRTGIPAARDSDGQLRINGDSAVTLVLLPGGMYWMGSQKDDPAGINYDPQSGEIEQPPHPVSVTPFFLSKYEMTQGQYVRVMASNPSVFAVDSMVDGRAVSMMNPVEGVSWAESVNVLLRVDLRLPTEEEWEYGARAGTSTPWWCGTTVAGLDHCSNVADRTALRFEVRKDVDISLNDGFGHHAPIGSFAPNAFGLHDTIGNVAEWVSSCYRNNYVRPVHDQDLGSLCHMRVNRGGSYFFSSEQGRSAWRDDYLAEGRNGTLGFRPARDLR